MTAKVMSDFLAISGLNLIHSSSSLLSEALPLGILLEEAVKLLRLAVGIELNSSAGFAILITVIGNIH